MNVLNLFQRNSSKNYYRKLQNIDPDVLDHVAKLFSILSSPMALNRTKKASARTFICMWAMNYRDSVNTLNEKNTKIAKFVQTVEGFNDVETFYFLNQMLFPLYKTKPEEG